MKLNNKFSPGLQVNSFPGFKTYYVFTDYFGGPIAILDEIAFNLGEEKSRPYAFIINKDTTYLYNTIGDEEPGGELLHLGKVKYKLVRQWRKELRLAKVNK